MVGPLLAVAALLTAAIVSSRVNDARTAQQFGVFVIIPITALLVAQFSGAVWLPAGTLAAIGMGTLILWVILAAISVRVFDRETILTRWR